MNLMNVKDDDDICLNAGYPIGGNQVTGDHNQDGA